MSYSETTFKFGVGDLVLVERDESGGAPEAVGRQAFINEAQDNKLYTEPLYVIELAGEDELSGREYEALEGELSLVERYARGGSDAA